jgi:hypothetical protein
MIPNENGRQKRIAEETPRSELVCEICGAESTQVRRFGEQICHVPTHTACTPCSFNPVTDTLEDFIEVLEE